MSAQSDPGSADQDNPVLILEIEGRVEVSTAGTEPWSLAQTNQVLQAGDRVRTGGESRAVLRLSDLTTLRVGGQSLIQVPGTPKRSGFNLLKGIIYFFHRDKPREVPVRTPTVYAVVLGTEFHLMVAEDGATELNLFDGAVEMTNQLGQVRLESGESGVAKPGEPPAKSASVEAANIIQWCLYYPGVLDLSELRLANWAVPELGNSIAAYEQGDLLAALANYPPGRQPVLDAERVYLAALLLAVGQVERSMDLTKSLGAGNEGEAQTALLAAALRTVITAVKGQVRQGELNTGSATALLAESYYEQSRLNLEGAMIRARQAAELSPRLGFAWARVAELEFGFGRVDAAREALKTSLRLAPRNAAAVALEGFVFAADRKMAEAIRSFDRAIALDGALGDAWLGKGLCLIRQGKIDEGRQALQVAATLEPQRAILRSYLGKAFQESGQGPRAKNELRLAKELDERDPTPWLYSGLLLREEHRLNQAVEDLQRSQSLNDNRRLYRSRLLLDQDRAVRGVNLATLYEDAGMSEVSRREASRAVGSDYANYSAHLFLADSYQALRDPKGIDQRFETAAVSEYLVANLLAPVHAGTLAHTVSRQEYSSLFESDGFGLAGQADYWSYGRYQLSGAHYGVQGNFGYALSGLHLFDNGQRPNNDLKQQEFSVQFKQHLTPKDSLYFRTIYGEAKGGDLAHYYDPTLPVQLGGPAKGLRFKETQEPLVLLGYDHEWGPGMHTLALAGWLNDRFRARNPTQSTLVLEQDPLSGDVITVDPLLIEQDYRNDLEIFTAEVQQLWQGYQNSVIFGGRYQTGDIRTKSGQDNADSPFAFLFPDQQDEFDSDFERISLYGYYQWRPIRQLQFTAGVSYDRLTFPKNFRYAPISGEEDTHGRVSPKAGVIWTPGERTTLRAGYARSLGGVSFDQSFRLEPTEVAGFNQAFRSLIPESVAGANANATFESGGISIEQRIGSGTYLGLTGEWLESRVDRLFGVFEQEVFAIQAGQTRESLDFRERSLLLTLNQLVGQEWAFAARYRVSQAQLENSFRQVSDTAVLNGGFRPRNDLESVIHQLNLVGIYNHSSGFYGQLESLFTTQNNHGYQPSRPGDEFWQFNAYLGYRFARRRAELRVGLLNFTDQDYRLNPLNLTRELPRGRTFIAGMRFNF